LPAFSHHDLFRLIWDFSGFFGTFSTTGRGKGDFALKSLQNQLKVWVGVWGSAIGVSGKN